MWRVLLASITFSHHGGVPDGHHQSGEGNLVAQRWAGELEGVVAVRPWIYEEYRKTVVLAYGKSRVLARRPDTRREFCLRRLSSRAPGGARVYLSTSSAWKRSVGGMVRPRAWAVFRLMTSSNLVGWCTGRSPGVAPFRILST
jgi:hypothetical protein